MILKKTKQICIVGCSGNLIGAKLGKKIDKQEIIVRFRMGLPQLYLRGLPESYLSPLVKDMGRRTDIYVNRTSLLKPKVLEAIKDIKYIFTDTTHDNNEVKSEELHHFDISGENVKEFRERMDYPHGKVTAGLAFILMCLNYKIPKINICGFTTVENYKPNELYEFFVPNYPYIDAAKTTVHDYKKERQFISLLLKEKRIHYIK